MFSLPQSSLNLLLLLSASSLLPNNAQVEFEVQTNYTYDEPVVFNEWCQEMIDMYGPSCVCTTTYGTSNGIDGLDLDHEVLCDPLQGNSTCIDGITVRTARVWLKANSIGEPGNYENIQQTQMRDLYVFLDDTSVGTTSFRYTQSNFNQRRTGCEAIIGGINCARCGLCNVPDDNRTLGSDDLRAHLSPNDIFAGISGQCRYGEGGNSTINLFNTCEDGGNLLTKVVWTDLEIKSPEETGPCPAGSTPGDEASGASTFWRRNGLFVVTTAGAVALLLSLWVL